MVRSITNLSRSGLSDWMLQRLSAVILAAYTIFIVAFLVKNPDLQYAQWAQLFSQGWVKIFTLLTVLSVLVHAWIGLWTVATDYIKATFIRFVFLLVVALTLFVYVLATVTALWG